MQGSKRTLAAACLGLACLAPAGPGWADVAGVAGDLDRLRGEVRELRALVPVQASDASRLAQFEVRLGRLEEEIRQLTGRVEQLEFADRRLEQRFDQLLGDLDARLRTMEQLPEDQVGAAGAGGFAAPEVPLSQGGGDGADGGPPAPRPGELGTIPESAVLDLPRPDPGAATPPRRTSLPPEEQYESAMELLRAGDYAAADRALELFLELNPDHELASNAAYWQAETQYVRRNYAAAAASFARNYRTYGQDAAKAPDNLLKLGMSLQGLGESDKACRSYEELASEFPNAPTHIRQALERERTRADCV